MMSFLSKFCFHFYFFPNSSITHVLAIKIPAAGGTNAVLAGMALRPGDGSSSAASGVSGISSDQTTR
jgi:hypothetical protein